uniref:PDZ and LIM domain protein Zasp n=2 Tax=Ascaris TaxID=6251 RepID=F1KTY4_ASCSU
MAQAEVVTVRMSRGNLETPWGFDIVPPLTICNVVGGSLADRAGLLSGDTLVELEGHENLDLTLARQLLSKAQHKVELVVHRTGSEVHRIWKPSITENTEYNRFQHSVHNVGQQDALSANRAGSVPSNTPANVPLKVSLEHHNQESVNIPGFNVTAQPYGAHQEVKHLQYNSPMPLYSPQSAAEQYLQQTGGLFGTDPNLTKMKETPSYLRSETLRLIQESEQAKDESSRIRSVQAPSTRDDDARPATQKASALSQCFLCGRNILGVMCRAYDRTLHAECFQCATCGSSLKNQGHHFVNEKFYCDVHGRQLKGRDEFRSTTLRPQGTIGGGSQTVTSTRKTQENVRAFYQPDIMARRPLSISPTPWKTQSPISPSNRGVPSSATHYGQDLRNESYSSSTITHQSNERSNAVRNADDAIQNGRGTGMTPNARNGNGVEVSPRSASESVINALQNLELRNNSSTNKFVKTTSTTQQHIRQGDDSARGRGTLQTQGNRVPFCEHCKQQIRGAYVLATGLAWCPEHFVCANKACNRRLLDIGFVEDKGQKYCEQCFENLIAPHCAKCSRPITADCLNALQKQWHPQCFVCAHCHKPFGNSAFFLEQGLPYCEADWNALFTTKCVSCHYPIEAGDRWVEALGSAFHSNCFNCTSCNVNLEGESFYAKNGAPYCKLHA